MSQSRFHNVIIYQCMFTDESQSSCEALTRSESQYAEVIWTFHSHPSSVNLFRLVLSGSQFCVSINTEWFVRGENTTGTPSECTVKELESGNTRVCTLICRCLNPNICGFLHYRVQFPTWVTSTLQLCHFELMTAYPGFINPQLVFYWVVHTFAISFRWRQTTV